MPLMDAVPQMPLRGTWTSRAQGAAGLLRALQAKPCSQRAARLRTHLHQDGLPLLVGDGAVPHLHQMRHVVDGQHVVQEGAEHGDGLPRNYPGGRVAGAGDVQVCDARRPCTNASTERWADRVKQEGLAALAEQVSPDRKPREQVRLRATEVKGAHLHPMRAA